MRITHKPQSLQAREVAEGPSRDTRELVKLLLRDRDGVDSETVDDTANGGMQRAEMRGDGSESGAGRITHEVQSLQAREVAE